MYWQLSEEHDMFTSSLRGWLADIADSAHVRSWLEDDDVTTFARLLSEEHWAGVGFGERLGGQGGGLLELALISREFGRAAVPSARWLQTALTALALAGEDEILHAALTGGPSPVLACRSDRIPAAASSVQCADNRLRGHVPCVLGAADSGQLIVPVSDDKMLTLWLLDSTAPDVEIRPRRLLDQSREAADLIFDGAPARRLEVDAADVLSEVAVRAAILVAADALGAAERMLALAVEYSKQRRQFDQPIGAFQAVKHAAAQMLVTVESSVSIVFYAAQSAEDGLADRATHAAVAKAQVTAGASEVADSALTIHGAIGYTWEHDLQLFYKRAMLDRVLFGAPAAWNARLADALPLLPVAT